MTPERIRIVARFLALLVCLTAVGCFVPGGGWTLRTGVDVRRHCKPAAFLELVDTRWDEYNRIAEINAFSCPVDSRAIYSPGVPPGTADGSPIPAAVDPMRSAPGSGSTLPPDSENYRSPTGNEPSPLPGTSTDETVPPAARIPPTARKPLFGGPRLANRDTEAGPSESGDGTVQVSGVKPAKRPMASRLFSRPQ
jgi:hypothetical protein